MFRMTTYRLIALASVAVLLPAQESTRLTGPTSGLIFDAPSRAIRVVMGVPGAAYLGAAVASDLDNGSVAPNGRLAVAVSAGAANLLNVADSSLASLGAGCDGVAVGWSADSAAVALGCADGVRLYRISKNGIDRVELAAFAAKVSALAVDGSAVLAAAADGIYRIEAGSARLLAAVPDASSFALQGKTLYAVDRAAKSVIAVDNLSTSAAMRLVVGAGQGLEDPIAVGVSADGARLYVADAGGESKALRVFDAATAEMLSRVELDFAPGRVDALGNGLYLLKARQEAADTVQVLDARQLAVYFIPAQDLGSVANLED